MGPTLTDYHSQCIVTYKAQKPGEHASLQAWQKLSFKANFHLGTQAGCM